MTDARQEARELTNISYGAHLEYLQGRVGGKKRAKAFITGAVVAVTIRAEPGSKQYEKAFATFISLGFNKVGKEGAIEAKDLYVEIYNRLRNKMIGKSDYYWIHRL